MAYMIFFKLVVAALAANSPSSASDSSEEPEDVVTLMQHFSAHKYGHQPPRKNVNEIKSLASHEPRMFCWAVVRPNSYEVELLNEHLDNNLISGCDAWAIYSNVSLEELLVNKSVGASLSSPSLRGLALDTKLGGRYNNSLNTPIFIQAWRHIFSEAVFNQYDWIIKIDIDTVFLPDRVRQVLRSHDDISQNAVFFTTKGTNFDDLTGSIEILSRTAVRAYAEKPELCESGIDYHEKSEDWYLDECLKDYLKLTWVPEPRLLNDIHQHRSVGTLSELTSNICRDLQTAAYHPLKTVEEFRSCLKEITVSGLSW